MLGKCLKYECRASLWLVPFLFLAAALLYGAGWAAKAIGIQQMTGTFAVGLLLVGIAGMVVAVVMVITRYYKGMFGAEGYLTQTLPVGKGTLLLSRLLTAILMVLLGLVLLLASLFGMLQLFDLTGALADLWRQLDGLGGPFAAGVLAVAFLQLVLFIAEVYAAITLANTRPFLSNNLLFSVLFYFGAQMAVGILEVAGLLLLPLGVRIGAGGYSFVAEGMLPTLLKLGPGQHELEELTGMTIGMGSVVVDAAALAALLLITAWLLRRKTSVK